MTIRLGRIGGLLIVGGCALLPLVVLIGGSGPVGVDEHPDRDISNLVMNASLALLGSGFAVVSLAGPGPLHGRSVRVGIGLVAIGLLSLLASSLIPIPAGSNSLQSWPYIITGTVGALALAVGVPVTVLSLVRVSGPTRLVGSLLLIGLLLLPIAAILSVNWTAQPLSWLASAMQLIGFSGVLVGIVGIGVLAFRAYGSEASAPG